MSAFICSDAHIATIAVRYGELIGASSADVQHMADQLAAINVMSVNYRYNEDTKIEPCSLDEVLPDLSFADLVALCNCLDYQSCGFAGYTKKQIDSIKAEV